MINVMSFPQNSRMSEAEYERERARLRDLYGDSSKEAIAKRDQAMATLFCRSGWTQEELAVKEGKSQPWIACRLRFGRFLNFITNVINSESLPPGFTEGRFRAFWERTEKDNGNERARFKAVHRLLAEESTAVLPKRPSIAKPIIAQFGDGKWHSPEVIAHALSADEPHVISTLRDMANRGAFNAKAERRQYGPGFQYRIFRQEKLISSHELIEKLGPIIEKLRAEGKKNMATMSPPTVAHLAHMLQQILDDWAK